MKRNECSIQPSPRGRSRAVPLAVISVVLLSGVALAAQVTDRTESGEGLTLWQAVERALASHPSVGSARARNDAATAAVREAEAGLRPSVSLMASATQFEEPMVVTPIHAFDLGQTPQFDETLVQAAAQVNYRLFDGGERRAKIRQAQAQADVAEASSRSRQQAIVARTVSTYLGVLNVQEVLAAHDQRLVALEAERERVRQRLDVGRAPEVELRRVEASVAVARAERVRLATSLETAERDLGRLIGGQVDEARAGRLVAVRLVEEELEDRRQLTEQAIGSSPAVEQARRALLAAEAAVALAKAARSPDLEAVGRYVDFGSSQGDFSGEWSAGIQLAVPLYTGGATRERIAKAEANREAAAEELRMVIMQAEEQLDRSLSAVASAVARGQSLEQAAASFGEVARTERLRLEIGTGTQTDYLDAEADLLVTRADLAQARHAVIAARAELARVTGELDPAWLLLALERVQ